MEIDRTHKKIYPQSLNGDFRRRLLAWLWEQEYGALYESHGIYFPFGAFPSLAVAGKRALITGTGSNDFNKLQQALSVHKDFMAGYLGYDLKNQLEDLHSLHDDPAAFPETMFFVPEHLFHFVDDTLILFSDTDPDLLMEEIRSQPMVKPVQVQPSELVQEISRETYLENVGKLQKHILDGDIYEINYCLHYSLINEGQHPVLLYDRLTSSSPTPFSCFYRLGNHYLVCASPERFLKKQGRQLISQPIKGTAHRSQDPLEDRRIMNELRHNEKEQAENMMIVDLVRNDLARSAGTGTVQVDEIFGIYSFAYLHQMISTVTADIREDIPLIDAIRNAFPMGSMTGAPKIKVMELIEYYENAKRGIYSGGAGFITPEGDFDFNVVIRSLFGNLENKVLRYSVGSAITFDSVPEKEYDECLLKARAILKILRDLGLIR